MKRFRFRFQKVLQVREAREKSTQGRFVAALRAWRKEREALELARGAHQETVEAMVTARTRTTVSEALLLEPGMKVTAARLQAQARRAQEAAQEASHRREDLVVATRARRVVEKLREQQRRLYLYELNWEEQKILDEVATQSFASRSRTSKERR